MNPALNKAIRALAGLALLALLGSVAMSWVNDYRAASGGAKNAKPTSTRSSEASTAPAGKGGDAKKETPPADASPTKRSNDTVVVLIDGLNFRKTASRTSDPIRGLDRGEELVLLQKKGTWYQVRDANGVTGWISANPTYVRVTGQ